MRRSLLVLSSFAIALGVAGGAFAQDSTDTSESDRIQNLVQPSVVFLQTTYTAVVRDTNSRDPEIVHDLLVDPVAAAGRCTGFFVNPTGYVATAGHCILPGDLQKQWLLEAAARRLLEEGITFPDGDTQEAAVAYAEEWFRVGKVTPRYAIGYPTDSTSISSEETTAARRVGYRILDEGDIGLLKFETNGVEMPGLELAETTDVQVGTPIVAVGFPGAVDDLTDSDYNPTFTSGDITRIGTSGGGSVSVYQHDADIQGGMSGGPVVDSDGRVIGITSYSIIEREAFDVASPVALLREVLSDKGVENDVGEVGTAYREGVEALYDKDRDKALDRFDEVLTHPGNPALSLAAPLRARAEDLPKESFPWWIVAVIVAALVLAAAAVVLLRRRGAAAPLGVPAYVGVPATVPPSPAALPPPAPAAPTRSEEMAPALVLVAPRGETAERHRLEGEMTIGREGTDVLLDDEEVSRRHATIRVTDGTVELTDLGSANGTEVNGQKLTETMTLGHGDTITVGRTSLLLELPPSMRGPRRSDKTVIQP